jgi:hypothetical protein
MRAMVGGPAPKEWGARKQAGAPFQPGFRRVERLKLALKRVAAFEFEDAGFDLHAVFVVVERAG